MFKILLSGRGDKDVYSLLEIVKMFYGEQLLYLHFYRLICCLFTSLIYLSYASYVSLSEKEKISSASWSYTNRILQTQSAASKLMPCSVKLRAAHGSTCNPICNWTWHETQRSLAPCICFYNIARASQYKYKLIC